MRKRRVIVLAVATLAVLGGVIWWTVASRTPTATVSDPVYEGHPLSYYLTLHPFTNASGQIVEAEIPVSLDSNAVPYLVQALKNRDGTVRMAYVRLWLHLPAWLERRVPDPTSEARITEICIRNLGGLGVAARPAMPELVRVLREDGFDSVRWGTVQALARIPSEGDESVLRALVAATKDNSYIVRAFTVEALGGISNEKDKTVIEALVTAATTDTNDLVRKTSGEVLWQLSPEAAAKAGVTNAAAGRPAP